jgi:hypothetical protein
MARAQLLNQHSALQNKLSAPAAALLTHFWPRTRAYTHTNYFMALALREFNETLLSS